MQNISKSMRVISKLRKSKWVIFEFQTNERIAGYLYQKKKTRIAGYIADMTIT